MDTPDRCFCELAPFYVLNLLEESDRRWVESQLQAEPELAIELADLEMAVAALPYAAPVVSPAPDLKARLFQRIGQPLPEAPSSAIAPPAPESSQYARRFADLKWVPYRVPGVQIAILHTDEAARRAVGVLRAEPGVCYPRHCHAGVEELYMLEGDLAIDGVTYGTGDYIRSEPGSIHSPETIGGCMFFFRSSLDDDYEQG